MLRMQKGVLNSLELRMTNEGFQNNIKGNLMYNVNKNHSMC